MHLMTLSKDKSFLAVVRKIGLKTISMNWIENSLMTYQCFFWHFTWKWGQLLTETVHRKMILHSSEFIYMYRKIVLRCNETQFSDVVFEYSSIDGCWLLFRCIVIEKIFQFDQFPSHQMEEHHYVAWILLAFPFVTLLPSIDVPKAKVEANFYPFGQ